jgi:polysaccharide deacetylase family protein (PEP-CTERM system associated)
MLPNVFSVDVEDYFHVQAFANRIRPAEWDHFESRVVKNTLRIVDLLDQRQTRGTFFVLGWVADHYPELIKQIHRAGHEIGCHSYWHQLVFRQTPDEFRADLKRATDTLQNIIAEPVTAYRAPSFSITADSLWALDVLVEEGYRIDSSIFPVRHDTYGIPEASPAPHAIHRDPGVIFEFPPAVRCKRFANIPVAGGGYFRMFPYRLTTHWLGNVNRKEGRPFVFYIHPWEVDPDQPRLQSGWKSRLRHYQNLHSTEGKLDRLLQAFPFAAFSDFACSIEDAARCSVSLFRKDGTKNLDTSRLRLDVQNSPLPTKLQEPHPLTLATR